MRLDAFLSTLTGSWVAGSQELRCQVYGIEELEREERILPVLGVVPELVSVQFSESDEFVEMHEDHLVAQRCPRMTGLILPLALFIPPLVRYLVHALPSADFLVVPPEFID